MHWQPETSHQTRLQRAKMLTDTRTFFQQKNVLEVETPALSQAGNTDPFIESFHVAHRYLHTSPEYPMKRLLAAGSGDIYQICKVWRKEEAGRNHNPEFTLLEWYRIGFSYQQLMQEVSDLLHLHFTQILTKTDLFLSYEDLFLENIGINPHIANHDDLTRCAKENISGLNCDELDHQAILDALLTHCIEPSFAKDRLTFIYDYPASQSALAHIRDETRQSVLENETASSLAQSENGCIIELSVSKTETASSPAQPESGCIIELSVSENETASSLKKGGGGYSASAKSAEVTYQVAERFEVYLGQMELGNGYQEEVSYPRNKQILQSENEVRSKSNLEEVPQDKLFLAACESGIPRSAGVAIGLDRVLMCISGEKSIQKVINFPWDKA